MQNLNFDTYLEQSKPSGVSKPTMRLLFTFISELCREEGVDYKTRLLLFKIAPQLAKLADESSEIFSDDAHPARRIISSIVLISKTVTGQRGAEQYVYKSLKESIKTLRARNIAGLACLQRVASDLDYIVKIAKVRSKPSIVSSIGEKSAGRIAQSKIKAAFIIVTEATKFDLSDEVLIFGLSRWLEFVTVTFIKFPYNTAVEKEVLRMTFSLFYLCSRVGQSAEEMNDKSAKMLSTLCTKAGKLVSHLGPRCLGHDINFSDLQKGIMALVLGHSVRPV